MTALALAPDTAAPDTAAPDTAAPVRRSTALRPAGTGAPRRLILPEQERRCRPPRPTRAGCGSASQGRRRATVRRRRLVLGTVAAGLLAALALPWSGTGGHALTTPGPALAGGRMTPGATYVVQPGDTLWAIAERMDPAGDPRPLVARLADEVGGDTVVAGEHVVLP